ncbi:hypothetical protein CBM2623_B30104 [Cupriavidus taiwanensis]|nr:hypothetical protein CBM2623_B30104 [Cupriavidus taiwanensis]
MMPDEQMHSSRAGVQITDVISRELTMSEDPNG